jgi:hypothetical protein
VIHVNVDNFAQAETALMFHRLASDAGGVNTWIHYREPAPLDHQPIIRQNRDTLYSAAIVDLSEGGTLTLPDAGSRYLSAMVVNEDHFIPVIFHDPGVHELSRDEIATDYALVAVRILVDPGDPRDVERVNDLQDQLALALNAATAFEPAAYDEVSQTVTRNALLTLSAGLPDFRQAFGSADAVDPRRHLVGTAAGWGGLPETEAHYVNVDPQLPVGEYQLRMVDVPVDAFWSVSLYNGYGYFEPNELGVNTVNSVTATPEDDGSVIVHFGIRPTGKPNFLTVMEGWNFLIRLYQPRPEALDGTWRPPALRPDFP